MNRIYPLLVALLLVGCKAKTALQTPPALRLPVAEVVCDTLPQRMQFISYLQSNFDAVIQPRVNGFLESKQFSNGMPVKRGSVLFTIDRSQFTNTMLSAEASLQSARAQAVEARNNYERAVPLAAMNAISRAELDQYTAQHKAAEAAVRSAVQSLRNAQLDVSYTRILSPIDGIVAGSAAHIGDYVGPGTEFTVLTTVSNIDTMSVDLAIPMAEYLRYAGDRATIYDNAALLAEIRLTLADGSRYPTEGHYKYTRKDVSSSTGTIVLVVGFPNPQQRLKPGQFARVEAAIGGATPRLLVPIEAVSQVQGVGSVWVVAADSTVHYREVVPAERYGALWAIESGIEAHEKVVLAGRQKLRNGAKIIPVKQQ
ncbi:MAG: efflux RND transporter periplasmic adaptor subunit [Alistipes sp.]|nr:efflux RND transporter periplasmic adaptor subunit [Alistipes sp.]